jgi:hypothetical protein
MSIEPMTVASGRNRYPCLSWEDEGTEAEDESPIEARDGDADSRLIDRLYRRAMARVASAPVAPGPAVPPEGHEGQRPGLMYWEMPQVWTETLQGVPTIPFSDSILRLHSLQAARREAGEIEMRGDREVVS